MVGIPSFDMSVRSKCAESVGNAIDRAEPLGFLDRVVHCLNVRRFPNVEQDAFSFLCQGRIHEMPSEYNAGHGWTKPANVVRIRHFAGDKAAKWRKADEVVKWRETPWEKVMEMHGEAR